MPFLGRYIIIYNYKFALLLRMSRMAVSATLTSLSGHFTLNKERTPCPLHRGFPGLTVTKPSTTPLARSTSFIAFAYGLHIWSSHMVLAYGLHIWSWHMVFTYGLHILSSHMVFTYGLGIWSSHMVFTYGLHIWSPHIVFTYGLGIWLTILLLSHMVLA